VHVNFEPVKSGNQDLIEVLKRLYSIKNSKIISIASYPPPTILHPHEEVHWDLEYYKVISDYVDQFVPMMYDTAITYDKIYINLMRQWTIELIDVVGHEDLVFGIPAYEDVGVGYHDPSVENLDNALSGVFAGLNKADKSYYSVAIYSEWTLDQTEVDQFRVRTQQVDAPEPASPAR
jgi:hypothetical protein